MRVLTLNLQHGRGLGGSSDSPPEVFRGNLEAVAKVLRREQPHVVALQEADASSVTSGGFDHVDYLAEAAGLPEVAHGLHGNMPDLGVRYGTAVISRLPLSAPQVKAFPGRPSDMKGYTVATTVWEGRELDVISVQLHDAMSIIRIDEARTLVEEIGARGRPTIVLGDLASSFTDEEKTLRILATERGLIGFEPEEKGHETYPVGTPVRRVDWILVTPELEIRTQRVLEDPVSGHRAVIAEVAWRPVEEK
jgi:endonuclease/exonuclease/phosphatase family metal-dependent hydrolase